MMLCDSCETVSHCGKFGCLNKTPERKDLSALLQERGRRYGSFQDHALISQNIKEMMQQTGKYTKLAPDQQESLEMIAHKIARILNGDADYVDSWVDIAGYATLVADRLKNSKHQTHG